MAFEWGRFVWWSTQNIVAIQVLNMFAVALLTATLIVVTAWYSRLTLRIARTMERQLFAAERQLVSSFQPDLAIVLSGETKGRGFSRDENAREETISGFVELANRGTTSLKLHAVHVIVWFEDAKFTSYQDNGYYADCVIQPGEEHKSNYSVNVKRGISDVPFHRLVVVVCTDLVEISQHWFYTTDGNAIAHRAPLKVLSWVTNEKAYFRQLDFIKQVNMPRTAKRQPS